MRVESVWLIVHPDQERIFVQPRPITKSRGEQLRSDGYMIFKAEVTLPPIADKAKEFPAQSPMTAREVWSHEDAPDLPYAETERPQVEGTGPVVPDPEQAGVPADEGVLLDKSDGAANVLEVRDQG